MDIRYEPENKRTAAYHEGRLVGECTYTQDGTLWILDHTFVDESMRGRQLGAALLKELMQAAREAGVRVRPVCPFVQKEFERHHEYQELLENWFGSRQDTSFDL